MMQQLRNQLFAEKLWIAYHEALVGARESTSQASRETRDQRNGEFWQNHSSYIDQSRPLPDWLLAHMQSAPPVNDAYLSPPVLTVPDHSAFASVPTELLSMIVDFIPLYPRISVLSRLSKRWRAAVMRSIRSLASLNKRINASFAAALPNVETISLFSRNRTLVQNVPRVTSSLRSIKIDEGTKYHAGELRMLSSISTLTNLRMPAHGDAHFLAVANRLTLRTICLSDLYGEHRATAAKSILTEQYSSLRKLVIGYTFAGHPLWTDFISRHAAQLESVYLTTLALRSFKFPALRKVRYDCEEDNERTLQCISTVVQNSPLLTCIKLRCLRVTPLTANILNICSRTLRFVHFWGPLAADNVDIPPLRAALAACSSLRHCSYNKWAEDMLPSLQLHSVPSYSAHPPVALVMSMTSLRNVEVYYHRGFDFALFGRPAFPHVTHLRLHASFAELQQREMQSALRAWPPLLCIYLDILASLQSHNFYVLQEIFCILTGKVEEVRLHCHLPSGNSADEFHKHFAKFKWLNLTLIPNG